MALGIAGAGAIGIGIETTPGTGVAPLVYFPIRSSSMNAEQNTVFREAIAQSADPIGTVPGYEAISGDLEMELLPEAVPYFLRAARGGLVKTGAEAPYTYTFTPNNVAVAGHTLSITEIKAGRVFRYVGCVVSSYTISAEDGVGMFKVSLIGNREEDASLPTPTLDYGTPVGAGSWEIQLPAATQVFDVDGFEFTVDDSGEAQNRLRDDNRGATFVSYGARNTTLSYDRDFDGKDAEFTPYKNVTETDATIIANADTGETVTITIPEAYRTTTEIPMDSMGDLIRQRVELRAVKNIADGRSYQVVVQTAENLTIS